MVQTLKDKALEYSRAIHEMGKIETENNITYSRELALEKIANDPKTDKARQVLARNLLVDCEHIVSDYNGESNITLHQDLAYALRTAAELIGPNGTKDFKEEFGLSTIKAIVKIYNNAVKKAYNRGSMLQSISVESYNAATEKPEVKRINLDKERKQVA